MLLIIYIQKSSLVNRACTTSLHSEQQNKTCFLLNTNRFLQIKILDFKCKFKKRTGHCKGELASFDHYKQINFAADKNKFLKFPTRPVDPRTSICIDRLPGSTWLWHRVVFDRVTGLLID